MGSRCKRVVIEGRPTPRPGDAPSAAYRVALPGYFQTIGMRLVRGRDFDERDNESSPAVAVINETMARRWWPGEDPLGKRFRLASNDAAGRPKPWMTVIGVIHDAKQQSWSAGADEEMYIPFLQDASYLHNPAGYLSMTLVARTMGPVSALAPMVRERIRAIDRNTARLDALEARGEREGTKPVELISAGWKTAQDSAVAIATLRAELASDQTELTRTVDIAAGAAKMQTPTQPSDQLSRCRPALVQRLLRYGPTCLRMNEPGILLGKRAAGLTVRRSRSGLSSSAALAATRRRHSNQEVIPFTALVFVSDQPPRRLTTPGPGLVWISRITVFRYNCPAFKRMRFAVARPHGKSAAAASASPGRASPASRR